MMLASSPKGVGKWSMSHCALASSVLPGGHPWGAGLLCLGTNVSGAVASCVSASSACSGSSSVGPQGPHRRSGGNTRHWHCWGPLEMLKTPVSGFLCPTAAVGPQRRQLHRIAPSRMACASRPSTPSPHSHPHGQVSEVEADVGGTPSVSMAGPLLWAVVPPRYAIIVRPLAQVLPEALAE